MPALCAKRHLALYYALAVSLDRYVAMEDWNTMSKNTSKQKRRRVAIRVPGWYYALLAAIALVGALLLVYSARNPTIDVAGMTEEGDFPMGAADAPVTMWEWGNFQ